MRQGIPAQLRRRGTLTRRQMVKALASAGVGVGSDVDNEDLYGYDEEYGLGGDASMVGMARYVAVAPRDVSTSLRNLDFEL